MIGSARSFNLADLYEMVADTCPDRTALVVDPPRGVSGGTRRLTYAELDHRANRVAHALEAADVRPADHVAVHAHNRAEWLECMLGCFKARAAVVNINYRYVGDELVHVLADSDAVALIGERGLVHPIQKMRDRLPRLRHVLALADDSTGESCEFSSYEDVLAEVSAERDFGPRSAHDPYLLYTGGTTGLPKGVLWRHEDIFFAGMGGGAGTTGEPIAQPEQIVDGVAATPLRYQVHAPLMHGGAQWASWQALTTGNTVVLWTGQRFDAHGALALADREHSQMLMVVGNSMAGPLAEALAERPGTYDLTSVIALGSGGAPLSQRVRALLHTHLPHLHIRDHLGVSETGAVGQAITATDSTAATRFNAGPEFAVLDEDLRPVTAESGAVGILARRGHIPLGYYNDPDRTRQTFVTDAAGVRWALQGDYATVDSDGAVTFLGRGSQVINTGGEKVYTEEVEAVLRAHPAVEDAIVLGLDDERLGSSIAAVVATRTGTSAPALSDHCRSRMAGYKIPRTIALTGSLPRTAVGKPDYPAAAELARQAHFTAGRRDPPRNSEAGRGDDPPGSSAEPKDAR